MYWIALITMLIDHIGYVFFPDELSWRMIGRLAFPIYAYTLYLGFANTRNLKNYMIRLFWLAAASQIPYMLAFNVYKLNVIWTLLASLIALAAADKIKNRAGVIAIYIVAGVLMEVAQMDYGAYGLLLVIMYRYVKFYWLIAAHFGLNYLYEITHHGNIQHVSLMSTILILCFSSETKGFHARVPRWLWRTFYPLHLAILAAIRICLDNTPSAISLFS